MADWLCFTTDYVPRTDMIESYIIFLLSCPEDMMVMKVEYS